MRTKHADVNSDYVMHEADLLTVGPRKRLEKENAELKKDYLAELGDLRQSLMK
jgi:hypothetical protein